LKSKWGDEAKASPCAQRRAVKKNKHRVVSFTVFLLTERNHNTTNLGKSFLMLLFVPIAPLPWREGRYEKIGLVLFHVIPAPHQVRGKLQPGDRREAE
jgi:hypothetical protein